MCHQLHYILPWLVPSRLFPLAPICPLQEQQEIHSSQVNHDLIYLGSCLQHWPEYRWRCRSIQLSSNSCWSCQFHQKHKSCHQERQHLWLLWQMRGWSTPSTCFAPHRTSQWKFQLHPPPCRWRHLQQPLQDEHTHTQNVHCLDSQQSSNLDFPPPNLTYKFHLHHI